MKKTFLFLTFFAVSALAFIGCKKNDNEPVNYLQVGDTTIYLSDGNIVYYGASTETAWNYDLEFVSSNIALSAGNYGIPDYTGEGTRFCFELFSSSSDRLMDGDYTFIDWGTHVAGRYDACTYSFDYNFYDTFTNHVVVEGTLSVKDAGNEFEIGFNGKDEQGKVVKMYYKGLLNYYDLQESK